MLCQACHRPFTLPESPSDEELSAILGIPLTPYRADAAAIQEDIGNAVSELKGLQEEIARLESQREQIKSSLALKVKSFRTIREDILSPIRRLPTEILLEIFSIASPYVTITVSVGFPWQLAHVCGRWRGIVLSSPALWSSIDLGFPDKDIISECAVVQARQLLKLCLARSGEHPLSIHLLDHNRNTEVTRGIVKTALRVRSRWKDLKYVCETIRHPASEEPATFFSPTLDLPMLQHLVLYPTRNLNFSILAPDLKSLDFATSPVSPPSVRILTQAWPRITRLRLSSRIERDDFARTLLQLPELSELDIRCVFRTNNSSSIPVHLDCLLILKTALGNHIIGNLTTPNLRTLLLEGEFPRPPSESLSSGQMVIDLLLRSRCSITRLILFGRYFSIRDLLGIMGSTPDVEHLDFFITPRLKIWEQLMYEGDLILLPRLHTLNLGRVCLPECRNAVRVVKSRADPPLDLGGRSSLDLEAEGKLRNLSLHLPPVKKNKERSEVGLLEQIQGFGGLKVDFDGELYPAICSH